MTEIVQGSVCFLAFLFTLISAWFWMLGGRPKGRIYYRLIAPLFFSLSVIGISIISDNFRWQYIFFIPIYLIISHLGHHSFVKRLLECWCYALPGVLALFIYPQLWTFWTLQLLLSTVAAVIGHFFNQKTAPKIEFLVNFLRVAMIAFMVC